MVNGDKEDGTVTNDMRRVYTSEEIEDGTTITIFQCDKCKRVDVLELTGGDMIINTCDDCDGNKQ